jgi:hypothetical protein
LKLRLYTALSTVFAATSILIARLVTIQLNFLPLDYSTLSANRYSLSG